MYRLLLASWVLAPVVDSAVCAVPCPGFVQGDCRCHDAGPWAMWICTRKGGALQAQPWFCSQPTCQCNGGGSRNAAVVHRDKARVAGVGLPQAIASHTPPLVAATVPATTAPLITANSVSPPSATVPATTAPLGKAATTLPCGAPAAPTVSSTQLSATTVPPTHAASVPTREAPKKVAAASDMAITSGHRRQHGKVRGAPPGLRLPCAPLPTPSHRFIVHACAWVDPATPCLVQCNASAGWHGAAAIFWCPAGNRDASQMAIPWTTWPNCSRLKNAGSARVHRSGLQHVQRSFLESSPHLRQPLRSPIAALSGIAVAAAMVFFLTAWRRKRFQQAEAQHFLGAELENEE